MPGVGVYLVKSMWEVVFCHDTVVCACVAFWKRRVGNVSLFGLTCLITAFEYFLGIPASK